MSGELFASDARGIVNRSGPESTGDAVGNRRGPGLIIPEREPSGEERVVGNRSGGKGRKSTECSNDQKSDLFSEVKWEVLVPRERGTSVELYQKCTGKGPRAQVRE